MKLLKSLLPLLTFSAALSIQAADLSPAEAGARLSQVLTCKKSAVPQEVINLIKTAGGKSIVQASDLSDGEYTLPNPIDVFGRPITKLGIHPGANSDGDFNEYSGQFSGESLATVAKLGHVQSDDLGDYRKEVGNHDLTLRVESGDTYITCANDVRTITKTIKRNAKQASEIIDQTFKSN